MNNISRRNLMLAASAAVLAPSLPAFALTKESAKALVDEVVAVINQIIASGKSESAMIRDFEKMFVDYADVPIIARYTLGADARSMSDAQISRYTKAFQGYMARKYGKRFREFIGGEVKVRGAKNVKSFVEVQTVAILTGYKPFEVSFHVADRGGEEKFFNMYIEGINLLLTERTEIQSMLDKRRGNVDAMIRDLAKAG